MFYIIITIVEIVKVKVTLTQAMRGGDKSPASMGKEAENQDKRLEMNRIQAMRGEC